MSDPIPDDDLGALFARQRAVDRERAPNFHAMRTHNIEARRVVPPVAPPVWRWVWPAAAAIGVVITAALIWHRPNPAATQREVVVREIQRIDAALQKSLAAQESLTAWQSPTDFLLNPIHNQIP